MQENKHQYNSMLLISTLIGLYLSSKWFIHEMKFILLKLDFSLPISWLIQAPLMLFIASVLIVSLLLFIGSISKCKPKILLENTPWKELFFIATLFNIIITIAIFANTYLKIKNPEFAYIFIFILLFSLYTFVARKYKINIVFFLVTMLAISTIFWTILFFIF